MYLHEVFFYCCNMTSWNFTCQRNIEKKNKYQLVVCKMFVLSSIKTSVTNPVFWVNAVYSGLSFLILRVYTKIVFAAVGRLRALIQFKRLSVRT